MVGTCKLCGEEKELCRRSHIIPNFMYQDLFDEKHRLHLVRSERGKLQHMGFRQSGEYDGGILCQSCDNAKLGKLERYASQTMYGGLPLIMEPRQTHEGLRYWDIAELDYTQFKLFLLSVLWRASISKESLFQEVRLGPYEKPIRQMLLTGDPGEQLRFPCWIRTYLNFKDIPSDVLAPPSRLKVDGGFAYQFLIAGTIYTFFITKRIIPDWVAECAINLKGELKIMCLKREAAMNILSGLMGLKLK